VLCKIAARALVLVRPSDRREAAIELWCFVAASTFHDNLVTINDSRRHA
jgi:hypothetical protein